MAIYSFNAGIVKRSTGQSVTAAAAYRAGEKMLDQRTGILFDYSRKTDVFDAEILLPAEAPEWMNDRSQLWNAVEASERRGDAQLARKLMLALPVELDSSENKKLVQEFVQESFIQEGMIADIAYHGFNTHNPHAHVLLTMRRIEQTGFSNKERRWNDKQLVEQWREGWAIKTNQALEKAGHTARVDHRTLKAQGIDREAQIHLGANVSAMAEKGIETDRYSTYEEIIAKNQECQRLRHQIEDIEMAIAKLEADWELPSDHNEKPLAEAIERNSPDAKLKKIAELNSSEPGVIVPKSNPHITDTSRRVDRTLNAVRCQLESIGSDKYEVLLVDRRQEDTKGQKMRRLWSAAEIEKALPWLKRMNVKGNDIYVRPTSQQGMALVDRMTRNQVKHMRGDGYAPALLLKVANDNYQAWVQLGAKADAKICQQASQQLAEQYGGQSMRYGRLAGFTNQEDPEDLHSYVLLAEWGGGAAAKGQTMLAAIAAEPNASSKRSLPKGQPNQCLLKIDAVFNSEQEAADYRFYSLYKAFHERFGRPRHFGRTDWSICCALAMDGYSASAIKGALRRLSPNQEARDRGNFEQYVTGLVKRVMKRPEVIHLRQQLALVQQERETVRLEPEMGM